jgi:hypothetical protein
MFGDRRFWVVLLGPSAAALVGTPLAAGQWTAVRLHDDQSFRDSAIRAVTATGQFGTVTLVQPAAVQPVAWSGSAANWASWAMPGQGGEILGARGNSQVGELEGRASLWHGTPESRVDLHVVDFRYSVAVATTEQEQSGYVATPTLSYRAVLWHGSAQSAVLLHPAGATDSQATAIFGDQQGGWARVPVTGGTTDHAALWSGTPESFLDLSPSGSNASMIRGMAAGQQVGWAGRPGQNPHAAMWQGTAQSWLDMNPPGYGTSEILATCGSAQVGDAGFQIAGIWFGTPDSFISLAQFLPPGYSLSTATSIAELNGVFYVGGFAVNDATQHGEAFLWIGIPAPSAALPLLLGAILAPRRRQP